MTFKNQVTSVSAAGTWISTNEILVAGVKC